MPSYFLVEAKLFIKEIGSMPPEKKHGLFILLVKLVVFGSFLTWLVVLEILDGQTCEVKNLRQDLLILSLSQSGERRKVLGCHLTVWSQLNSKTINLPNAG